MRYAVLVGMLKWIAGIVGGVFIGFLLSWGITARHTETRIIDGVPRRVVVFEGPTGPSCIRAVGPFGLRCANTMRPNRDSALRFDLREPARKLLPGRTCC